MKQPILDNTRKRFFALGREMGFDSEELKVRAKKFYKETDTFNNLTEKQIGLLITKLEAKQFEVDYTKNLKRKKIGLPSLATFKQLGLIGWMIRMHKPELEEIKGYNDIKTIEKYEASRLIDDLKNDRWDDAELRIKKIIAPVE